MTYFLILLIILTIFLVKTKLKTQTYWLERGVKHGSTLPFFGDSLGTFLRRESFTELIKRLYFIHQNERYIGCYHMTKPTLIIRDPALIKTLMVKDFDYFTDHRSFTSDKSDKLWSKNLFFLKGDEWRAMRNTLTPAFTSNKMKAMFPLIITCAQNFSQYFALGDDDHISLEFKDIFRRFANDVIASCGFGLQCDSFRDKNNEFYLRGKEITNFGSIKRKLKFFLFLLAPKICQIFKVKIFSNKLGKFFLNLVDETIKYRVKNSLSRPDMVQLLMDVNLDRVKSSDKHKKLLNEKLSVEDITAQVLIFFFAGFDTVSTLMSFMAYELALNPLTQKKLQDECDSLDDEKFSYDDLQRMKYMEMVIMETLRKWPPAVSLDRVCVKPYTIKPVKENEKALLVKKGDVLWFPIIALHHNPKYFPAPELFDPERFNEDKKAKIQPFTYLPFGEGPRNCLASRFVIMETKIVFFYLLKSFELTVVDKTNIPFKISKKQFNLGSENGFWLGLRKRLKPQ